MSGCSHLPARLLQRREFRWAPVPQSAEGADSKPAQCAFESHRGHSDMAILRIARRPRAVPDLRRASSSPLREPLRGPLGTTPRPRAVPDLRRASSSPLREPLRAHSPRQGPTVTEYGGRVTEPAPHMTPEQFREHGHEVVDWIADYWSRIGSFPVRSQVPPGDVPPPLPPIPPEQGEPFSAV